MLLFKYAVNAFDLQLRVLKLYFQINLNCITNVIYKFHYRLMLLLKALVVHVSPMFE